MLSKTKIVCTIGPASWDQEVMRYMIKSGMNVARVNGAFADPDELDKVKMLVRNVSSDVSLMVDVKGPEVRMNKFPEPIKVKVGDHIVIGNSAADHIYPSNYKDLYKFVKVGQRIVVGDGDVELRVEEIKDEKMICNVIFGESIKPGKALNLPGCEYSTDILTEKDKINLKHAIETGWEFVSASFIQDAKSAAYIRDFIHATNGQTPMKVIAKIENQAGVDNIDEILEIVDGVMIARGGLGIELGLEKVPAVQRLLIQKCNALGKPVITATQMLESMNDSPRPTRAEVNDVATAIYQGTDAVMLSSESSSGKFPVDSVKAMRKIANETEQHIVPELINTLIPYSPTTDALTKAIATLCHNMENEIATVIIVSKTGTTARLLSRHRVKQDIFVYTSSEFFKNTSLLSKGISAAFVYEGISPKSENYSRDNAVEIIIQKSLEKGIVKKGEKILFIGKTPMHTNDYYFPNVFEVMSVQD